MYSSEIGRSLRVPAKSIIYGAIIISSNTRKENTEKNPDQVQRDNR